MIVERPSVCTLDCPDTCSLTVTVENDRIVKVRGSDALPYTGGVICNKVARDSVNFVHGANRLHYPLRRIGPARLRHVRADRLGRGARRDSRAGHGGDRALGPAGGDAAQLCGTARPDLGRQHVVALLPQARRDEAVPRRAVRRGAQRGLERDLSARPGISPEAAADADLNLVWGNNATVTNLHLVRAIWEAKRKGGRLVVIDPLRSKIAERADLHLALRPGTDVVLGFALAVELERLGAHDRAFIDAMCRAMTTTWRARANGRPARAAELRRAGGADPPARRAGWRRRARWYFAGQRARARAQRRQRRARGDRASGADGQARPQERHRARRAPRLSEDARPADPARPRPPGTRTLKSRISARHLATDDIDPPLRRCSSTTTTRSWCIRTRTG